MIHYLIKSWVFVFFILSAGSGVAQNPISLYYLENLPQNNNINAAIMPRCNAFVGVPLVNSIYTSVHSDVSGGDLLQKVDGNWVLPIDEAYDYDKLYSSAGDMTSLSVYQTVGSLFAGFRYGKGYFSFSMSEKVDVNLNIATDMLRIADKGFPDNSSFDFSDMGVKMKYYREFSLGYAREINSQLTLGVHVKPLFGQVAVETKMDKFELYTSRKEYRFKIGGKVYSSIPIEYREDEYGFPDSIEVEDLTANEAVDQYGINFSNPGIAFDVGGVYQLNDAWSFSMALNNLGFISWKEDLHSISFTGNAFDGYDVSVVYRDSIDEIFSDVVDSLKQILPAETGGQSFSSGLTPTLYVGSLYEVNHILGFGFLSRSIFQKRNFRQAFSLSANLNLYHFLTANLNYNLEINSSSNFGVGLAMRAGPLQLYVLADHVPTKYNLIDNGGTKFPASLEMETVTFMFGLNLIFGANGYRNLPMVDAYSEY